MIRALGLAALCAALSAVVGCGDQCISDNDHDGFYSANLCKTGTDCNDLDASVHPGAEEVCDGIDNDCNGLIDDATDPSATDLDRDGYMSASCPMGTDCDDQDGSIHPGAPEACNGKDDDCDGIVDNKDADGDGSVDVACGGSDCNDSDPSFGPNSPEICDDGLDNNCNGTVDGGDADGDGFPSDECPGGTDCDDQDAAIHPGAPELCDDIDQDCDGVTTDVDADGDGDIAESCGGDDCEDSDPTIGPSSTDWCTDGIDNNCDGTVDFQDADGDGAQPTECGGYDCDDHDATVSAGMPEICGDGKDNDCSGTADDKDDDYDKDMDIACGGTDCDDEDPDRSGLLPEECDAVDADCDGDLRDADLDGDGEAPTACGGGDCNDSLPNVGTRSPEVCDGLDNDCDGNSDGCAQRLPGAFDFSGGSWGWTAGSGWSTGSGAVTFAGVGDSIFHSFYYGTYKWTAPYLIEADLTRQSGDTSAAIGLEVCDTSACKNGVYAWMHEGKGLRVQVGRIDGGTRTTEHDWRPTSGGYQGYGFVNRLRIYHSGTRLYVLVNGVAADDLYVNDLTSGYVRVVAEDLPGDSSTGAMGVTLDNVYGSE